jgi:hypothetical protein
MLKKNIWVELKQKTHIIIHIMPLPSTFNGVAIPQRMLRATAWEVFMRVQESKISLFEGLVADLLRITTTDPDRETLLKQESAKQFFQAHGELSRSQKFSDMFPVEIIHLSNMVLAAVSATENSFDFTGLEVPAGQVGALVSDTAIMFREVLLAETNMNQVINTAAQKGRLGCNTRETNVIKTVELEALLWKHAGLVFLATLLGANTGTYDYSDADALQTVIDACVAQIGTLPLFPSEQLASIKDAVTALKADPTENNLYAFYLSVHVADNALDDDVVDPAVALVAGMPAIVFISWTGGFDEK